MRFREIWAADWKNARKKNLARAAGHGTSKSGIPHFEANESGNNR
jgi:hypothetical protein